MGQQRGVYIAFAGGEGVGKSTQIRRLEVYLLSLGLEVLSVREPGGTRVGGELRRVLLHPELSMVPLVELFLFSADRAQLWQEVIEPVLARGGVILSDRSYIETFVYQLHGRMQHELRHVLEVATQAAVPRKVDLCLFFDLDPETGLMRARKRSAPDAPPDHFEKEELAFHRRVYQGFLEEVSRLARAHSIIDAYPGEDVIEFAVREAVVGFLRDEGLFK